MEKPVAIPSEEIRIFFAVAGRCVSRMRQTSTAALPARVAMIVEVCMPGEP